MQPIVIIPVRLASQRLPRKAIVDIAGKPMINWVVEAALAAKIGPVLVAGCSDEIGDLLSGYDNVQFVLTDPDLPSGTDRIYKALQQYDPELNHDVVVNLQGDLPNIDPQVLSGVAKTLQNAKVDIATPVCVINDAAEAANPNIVKVAMDTNLTEGESSRALYFSRNVVPANSTRHYHHIGIYAFRRQALERFISLPPSPLEQLEKLEQLRALEAGMSIHGILVGDNPISVDDHNDLEKVRKALQVYSIY